MNGVDASSWPGLAAGVGPTSGTLAFHEAIPFIEVTLLLGSLKALSFRIGLPKWAHFEGKSTIILHKMYQVRVHLKKLGVRVLITSLRLNSSQGCVYWSTPVMMRIAEQAGFPIATTSFARHHINGFYMRYSSRSYSLSHERISFIPFFLGTCSSFGTMRTQIL